MAPKAVGKAPASAAKSQSSSVAAPPRLRAHTAELESVFKKIDLDNDGKLSEADLSSFMKDRVGSALEPDQLRSLILELRGPGTAVTKSGESMPPIDFPTFLGFVDCQLSKPLPELLAEVFKVMDTDHDGKISAQELEAFSAKLNLNLGLEGSAQLLDRGNRETTATFPEFCALVQKALPAVDR
ncbi:calmodulin cam1 [Cystoisospora suis]|uniref:Calmodulin cam1 n=1 Tax=Cystoisospora suis TaxID=483139 RepID=A0A2C6KPT6_9APIC|nr:calmodulin cam1 [Cystoisospora suis]